MAVEYGNEIQFFTFFFPLSFFSGKMVMTKPDPSSSTGPFWAQWRGWLPSSLRTTLGSGMMGLREAERLWKKTMPWPGLCFCLHMCCYGIPLHVKKRWNGSRFDQLSIPLNSCIPQWVTLWTLTHSEGTAEGRGYCQIVFWQVWFCWWRLICFSPCRPLWLSPRQVMFVPVNPSLEDYAKEVDSLSCFWNSLSPIDVHKSLHF